MESKTKFVMLILGYVLVAGLAFGLGRSSAPKAEKAAVSESQATVPPVNYTPNQPQVQSAQTINCSGKIKGSSGMVYHLPTGAFYSRVKNPIKCFDTEAEAQAAGFRKSSK